MYCADLRNNVNHALREAVSVQSRCGNNRSKAIATVADWLGVSPRVVEMRINDEIVGQPRSKKLLADRCWDFLAMVAKREHAWVENLAAKVEQNRLELQQLSLPLEGTANANPQRIRNRAERRVARSENDVAAARRELATFEKLKRSRIGRG